MRYSKSAVTLLESFGFAAHAFVAPLDRPVAHVRIAALRALGCFLAHCSPRSHDRFVSESGFAFIGDKLAPYGVGEHTCAAVLQLLVADTRPVVERPRVGDTTHLIHASALTAFAELLAAATELAVVHAALQDLIFFATSAANCDAVLALSCWPLWLLQVPLRAAPLAHTVEDVEVLFELSASFIATLLAHAVRKQTDGWQHVEEVSRMSTLNRTSH